MRTLAAVTLALTLTACSQNTNDAGGTTAADATTTQPTAAAESTPATQPAQRAAPKGLEMDTFAIPTTLQTTPSGLQYSVEQPGTGAQPQPGQTVQVHYTGWLTNGTKFDSSRDRGQPLEFPVGTGRVIRGWDEGIAAMKVGEKRTLVIPPDLGYGARGTGGGLIPPNATLVFAVELVGVR